MKLPVLAFVLVLAGCATPPPEAYVGGVPGRSGGVGLGTNAAGEACTQQPTANGVDIFCGTWDQPSGHVAVLPAAGTDLRTVATASPWRTALDSRFDCSAPESSSILSDVPALVLSCTRKVGGWPQAALVARVGGRDYVADGILPAAPVLQRSIAVLSGRAAASAAPSLPPGQAQSLLASRLAAQSFSAGDIGQFQQLMDAGTRANLDENYAVAERTYRAAYALQRKALGANDPNTASPLMLIALQLSDQGRTNEADAVFTQAAALAGRSSDPLALPRLRHYQALNDLNSDKPAEALPLLQAAEAGYAATLPPELLTIRPPRVATPLVSSRRSGNAAFGDDVLLSPERQAALIGVVETRRYQAIALRQLNRSAEARQAIRGAMDLARSRSLTQRDLSARLSRTAALVFDAAESGSGQGSMQSAERDFTLAQPGTRPLAQTLLLRAAQAARSSTADALASCRAAMVLLRELKTGTESSLMSPCLAAFATEASRQPPENRQALLREMFVASQLVQGSITARQIALASARLQESAKDSRVGDAIRRQQDTSLLVAGLQSRIDTAGTEKTDRDALEKQLTAARATLADADATLQAAAPNYGQLVQSVAEADDVLRALAPGEALVSLVLERDGGWVFLLRDGAVTVAAMPIGTDTATALVTKIRSTVELPDGKNTPPPFATDAARALYDGTLGRLGTGLDGIRALTVVPAGPLLALPFELLLTGPADPANLARAPFLVQRFAITHVPAASNFVSLRRLAATAAAARPWYGFGDFRPVTLQQAAGTFPAGACENSARLFAGLPPLPYAIRELTAARMLMGAPASDTLLGAAFTSPGVLSLDLRAVRVLHFATHALLPTDLRCQTEPAIVTSDLPGAPNAKAALLTSSDVTGMKLDADVVILSACNSGGPDGATSGESLSGLARAFFYAGARAMMVTHWSINDQVTALIIAGTLQRLKAGDPQGLAGAFQATQLAILADAGTKLPVEIAHPFYWAPFALVGEGQGRTVAGHMAGL